MNLEDLDFIKNIDLRENDALIVVDVQNDFMPGGALAAEDGDQIVPGVNEAIHLFTEKELPVVFTQDWHPEGHYSFASSYEDKDPFEEFETPGLGPVLWPDHCIQGSSGAGFHKDLNVDAADAVIRKGIHLKIDSYSGFLENDHQTETGLSGYLESRNIRRVFVCGLALDYCVFFTAKDAAEKGFDVFCLTDLTKAVKSPEGSVEKALTTMDKQGVSFTKSPFINT